MCNTFWVGQTIIKIQVISPIFGGIILAIRAGNVIKAEGGSSNFSKLVRLNKVLAYGAIALTLVMVLLGFDFSD